MNHKGKTGDCGAREASGSPRRAWEGRAQPEGQWGGGEWTLPGGLRARKVGGQPSQEFAISEAG